MYGYCGCRMLILTYKICNVVIVIVGATGALATNIMRNISVILIVSATRALATDIMRYVNVILIVFATGALATDIMYDVIVGAAAVFPAIIESTAFMNEGFIRNTRKIFHAFPPFHFSCCLTGSTCGPTPPVPQDMIYVFQIFPSFSPAFLFLYPIL